MIDASSSQVVLRVTAQMLQFARALAVDEGDLGRAGLGLAERTVYQISNPGVFPPERVWKRRLPSHVRTTADEGNVGPLLRLVLQCYPVSSWIDTKSDISSLLPLF